MKNNKKLAKKTPAAKAKAAPAKKAVSTSKTLKNNKKIVAKAPAKKPVAKVVKKPAIKAVKQPAKIVKVSKAPAKSAVKSSVKTVAKPVSMKTMAKAGSVKTPIVVKAAQNQNTTMEKAKPMTTAKVVVAAKPQIPMQKMADPAKVMSAPIARPAYRPIQVINKPLPSAQPTRAMAPAPMNEKVEYKKGDYVVYPAHGVGQIEAIESQIIAGMDIKLYAIVFEKDRMRLKVPVFKAHASGLRRLSSPNQMQDALKTLQGRAHVRRVMWSRRAQEYETKINSGDPVSIAEVLRDLKRANDDNEQSYSERQIYQSALERLAREVAALERISEIEASEKLETLIRGKRAAKVEDKKADDSALKIEESKAA